MKTFILAASVVLGAAVLPAAASAQDYPPCGPDRTDKCMQHEGDGAWQAAGDHHMRHHWRRHHHARHHG